MVKGVNDHESSVYIDNGLHSYIGYLTSTIGQLVVVNLLLPLAEDNKLKKLVNKTWTIIIVKPVHSLNAASGIFRWEPENFKYDLIFISKLIVFPPSDRKSTSSELACS